MIIWSNWTTARMTFTLRDGIIWTWRCGCLCRIGTLTLWRQDRRSSMLPMSRLQFLINLSHCWQNMFQIHLKPKELNANELIFITYQTEGSLLFNDLSWSNWKEFSYLVGLSWSSPSTSQLIISFNLLGKAWTGSGLGLEYAWLRSHLLHGYI